MVITLNHQEVEFIYNFMQYVTLDVTNWSHPWMLLFAEDQPVAKDFVNNPRDEYKFLITESIEYRTWLDDMEAECDYLSREISKYARTGCLDEGDDYKWDNLKLVSSIIYKLKNN